ncbi:MAG: DUF4258 domain-containing protein [Gammaproteobacteria bacterium]|nr:DUF4258 domain-containing protein [Gammaproteobacteria bacterium]NNJ84306.1 DUF4258 domain-containing protein [Gammaproteobacteria bacterium]
MLSIEWIQDRIKRDAYYLSGHAEQERQNDNLRISEIRQALLNGVILEYYEDTGRGESCLVAGFTGEGKPIHIICGERKDKAVIVTVYIPLPPKFITPYERG